MALPEHGQGVVAELAPGRWRIGLELVGPAPEQREAAPVPDHGIEGREQAQPLVEGMAARAWVLVGGPVPGGSVYAATGQLLARQLQRCLGLLRQMGGAVAQQA